MSILIGGSRYDTAGAFEQGIRHHEAGRIAEAEAIYRQILAVDPDHSDSLHLMGLIAFQFGHGELAVTLIGRAVELNGEAAPYHNNLANALRGLGRLEEAAVSFANARRLRPNSPEISNNLGSLLRDLGRLDEAVTCFRAALAVQPNLAEVHYNLANCLFDQGHAGEAEQCYRRALELRPDYADAAYNYGNLLRALGRLTDAEARFRMAIALKADNPEAYNNLGTVLQELNRAEEAEAFYRAALIQKPGHADARYNLGSVLQADNRIDEAAECYRQALAANPAHGAAKWALCMAQLPILYDHEAEIAQRRAAYTACLDQLIGEAGEQHSLAALADGVGTSQPFFLAYQGQNDRDLQSRYGALATRVLAATYPPVPLAPPARSGEKLRVGIVSGFFYDHTVWRLLIEGWVKHLDRNRFEVFGYHTGTKTDAYTDVAARACDRFQRTAPVEGWRDRVAADAPHILLYPEIGMDPIAARLAAQRLAPVQCGSWGHPETSGFPTVDYFLTSQLMEPPQAEAHYTERLVPLPNLAAHYEPDEIRPAALDRTSLGLRPEATLFWSGQALYKYLPQFDPLFPRIAQAAGNCQFVFIEFAKSRQVTALFRRRLERAFEATGLKAADYCVFLPPMGQDRFIAAAGLCDVALDTPGWSGGKSTLDCLATDTPIVTWPGPFMRGRHTAAILTMMGITETIAETLDGYVETAGRLARDADWRQAVKSRVATGKQRVYRDRSYIAALEDFLDRVGRAHAIVSGD